MSRANRKQRKVYLDEKEWSQTAKAAETVGETTSQYIRNASLNRNKKVFTKNVIQTI